MFPGPVYFPVPLPPLVSRTQRLPPLDIYPGPALEQQAFMLRLS